MDNLDREKLEKAYYNATIAEQKIKTKLVWSFEPNNAKTQYVCTFWSNSGKTLVKVWGMSEKQIKVDDIVLNSSSCVWLREFYLDKGKHKITIDCVANSGLGVEVETRNGRYDNKS